MGSSSCNPLTLLAITLISVVISTRAQIPDCAANLVPCAGFLNSTNPPETCCGPLRQTMATQKDCLCSFYNNPTLVQSLGINLTQSLMLPSHCNITSDTNFCNNATAPTGMLTPPPPGGSPGRDRRGRDDSSAGKMAWAGASGLLLFWVSILAH